MRRKRSNRKGSTANVKHYNEFKAKRKRERQHVRRRIGMGDSRHGREERLSSARSEAQRRESATTALTPRSNAQTNAQQCNRERQTDTKVSNTHTDGRGKKGTTKEQGRWKVSEKFRNRGVYVLATFVSNNPTGAATIHPGHTHVQASSREKNKKRRSESERAWM
jgi:hypothetical protein